MNIFYLSTLLTPSIFLFILIILVVTLIFLGFIYKKEKQFEEKREHMFENYDQVLTKAHTQAETILATAAEQAATFTSEDERIHQAIRQQTEKSFQELVNANLHELTTNSESFLKAYTASIQGLREKHEKEMGKILQDIQQVTQEEFNQFKEIVSRQTHDSQDSLTKQLKDSFEKTQIEIHEYKRHKLQEVNDSLNVLLLKVAEAVLGKAIPLADHQKLILDALEKAQKEGMFV